MINVSRVINDPRFSRSLTIYRKKGAWGRGRFEGVESELNIQGVISVAKAKDVEMIPECDRIGGEMVIHTTQKIFTTNENGTSDELLWEDERYKIYSVSSYKSYGFYKAIAMRKSIK